MKKEKEKETKPLFVTWGKDNEKEKMEAFEKAAKAFNDVEPLKQSVATNIFQNIERNTSVRDGYSRKDYEYFRPEEGCNDEAIKIKKACMRAYRKIGLVHNIIDLMTDFTCQGIHLTHASRPVQKFYEAWWSKVNGAERSERFVNKLLRTGTTAVQRTTAKLKQKDIDNLNKGFVIGADVNADTSLTIPKNEIPWKYTFLNPLALKILGDDLAVFSGEPIYGLQVPAQLVARIKAPKNSVDVQIVNSMPGNIVNDIRKGKTVLQLDPNKVSIFHYKKDDWEAWGDPLVYPVLDDLIQLEKTKLADITALDGAVSHIRLWKLGSLEHRILPTPEGAARLAEVLLNNVGGGSMDLIWGPELTLEETGTDIHQFLGKAKYEPVLEAIYAGLGIPPTLTGSANASGFTNNYISLKTLLERLNYVRMILIEFWDKEVKLVQRAMGFSQPAQIQFDRMTLSDEASEKKLLLDLADRNIISIETVQERFGEIPELERIRLKREHKETKKKKMPRKVGPYAEQEDSLQKIALQNGIATPSEVGLELDERKKGEVPMIDQQAKHEAAITSLAKPKGIPGQGRPKNKGDATKRKKKKVIPRTSASLFMQNLSWARKTQKKISDIADPVWLEICGKKDLRSLSDEDFTSIEKLKFAILCNLKVSDIVDDKVIKDMILAKDLQISPYIENLCKQTISKYKEKFEKEPTLEEIRQIQASAYSLYEGEYENV